MNDQSNGWEGTIWHDPVGRTYQQPVDPSMDARQRRDEADLRVLMNQTNPRNDSWSIWDTAFGRFLLQAFGALVLLSLIYNLNVSIYQYLLNIEPIDAHWILTDLHRWGTLSFSTTLGALSLIIYLKGVIAWCWGRPLWKATISSLKWLIPLSILCPIAVAIYLAF